MARIVLVVTGGIAAYKTPALVRELSTHGHELRVVCTESATAFVSELALAAVSGHPVRRRLLDSEAESSMGHIELADWAELVLVAPATADFLARMVAGRADDLATAIHLATKAPVVVAPAMNVNMWQHPATRANVAALKVRGIELVGPESGALACGWSGEGRMSDPSAIAAYLEGRANAGVRAKGVGAGRYAGQSVLVTAGPTRTYLDPVRFVTNASSGVMGFELAAAFAREGAEVVLIAGPVSLATPDGVERVDVESAGEMLEQLRARLARGSVAWVAKVAAVSDLRLVGNQDGRARQKLEKSQLLANLGPATFEPETDLLATITREYQSSGTRFLGFAAQTLDTDAYPADDPGAAPTLEALAALGAAKATAKGCDALFVNRVGVPDSGFASVNNSGVLLLRSSDGAGYRRAIASRPRPKSELASWLVEALSTKFEEAG